MAKTQIKNYTFKPGIGALDYAHPDACSLLSSNKTFIQKAVQDINDNLPSRVGGWLETKIIKKGAKIDRLVFSFS